MIRTSFDRFGKAIKKIRRTRTQLFTSYVKPEDPVSATQFTSKINSFVDSLLEKSEGCADIVDIKLSTSKGFNSTIIAALVIYEMEETIVIENK